MTREEALHAYIEGARWFGGKGRDFTIEAVRELPHGIHLVDIAYDDGDGGTSRDCYQLPLSSYDEPQERLTHALVGIWDDQNHYDAVHDRQAMADWLRAFDESGRSASAPGDEVAFHRVPGHELDLGVTSSLFSGEQSNSSVAFGEDSLMKVFRRVTAGVNPDIEIHRVLTEAGSENVAQLYGWIDTMQPEGGEPLQLAMLQQFLRTATEGWVFALTSVRNLFAEADLHPEEVGGDFAGESHRLGVAVAEVHALLREHFPTGTLDVRSTVEAMNARLDRTVAFAPDLEATAAPVRAAYERLAGLSGDVLSQRIHGDLHLGQTLRTARGWKIVDFEGEPAKPLAERMLPDSPWRDVAGMLRSFDYAARTVLKDVEADDDTRTQLTYRADEWVHRNRQAFLAGYASVVHGGDRHDHRHGEHDDQQDPELTTQERVLVAAYELDKAVYEVGYELRNRPDWIDIPMTALARAGDEGR